MRRGSGQIIEHFRYDVIPVADRDEIRGHAAAIRGLLSRSAECILEIGRRLNLANERFDNRNQFAAWVKAEFNWSYRSACRLMYTARKFVGRQGCLDRFRPSALYHLATGAATEAAVDECMSLAERGVVISGKMAEELIEKHRGRANRSEPPMPAVTRTTVYKLRHYVRGLVKGATATQREEIARELERLASDLREPAAKAG